MSGNQASLAKCPYCPGLYQQLHIHLSSSRTCRGPSGGIFVQGAKVCIPIPNKTKPKKAVEEYAEHSQFNGLSDMEFPPGFRNIYPLAHPNDGALSSHVKNNTYSDNESDAAIGDMLDYMDEQGDDTVNLANDDIIFNGKSPDDERVLVAAAFDEQEELYGGDDEKSIIIKSDHSSVSSKMQVDDEDGYLPGDNQSKCSSESYGSDSSSSKMHGNGA